MTRAGRAEPGARGGRGGRAIVAPVIPGERSVDLPTRLRGLAAIAPDAPALIDETGALTRQALVRAMDRIASRLAAEGVRRGDVVATVGANSAAHVAVYLGIQAAGAAVAPLPATAHPDALAAMAANARARVIVADHSAPDLPRSIPRLDLDALAATETTHATPVATGPTRPDDLVDIVYSSGTTGAPKGIEHDLRFRDRQLRRFARLGYGPDATALVTTPFCSNTTLAAMLPAIGLGATVVTMRRFDAAAVLALAERHRVTHAMLVPVQVARLLAAPEFDRTDLAALSTLLATSAPFPAGQMRALLDRWPGRLFNIYGMTEGGVSTMLDARAHPDRLATVGRPTEGAEIRILGADDTPLPPGEAGEIAGRAPSIMRGYRAAPDQTAAALWHEADGRAFIRTGDIGRIDADGFLTVIDRRKEMILSGGFNIFPSDLEAALMADPAVREAAVFALPDPRWGETPAAVVVLAPEAIGAAGAGGAGGAGGAATPADAPETARAAEAIRARANARLGKTQRIAALRILPALPRSAIGKVLKRELQAAWTSGTQPEPQTEPQPEPQTEARTEARTGTGPATAPTTASTTDPASATAPLPATPEPARTRSADA